MTANFVRDSEFFVTRRKRHLLVFFVLKLAFSGKGGITVTIVFKDISSA